MTLSPREQENFSLLYDGMSVPKSAEQPHISLSSEKIYVARVCRKLGAHNRAQALMNAVRLGTFEDGRRIQAVV
jgi:DNA-binding NarL/FixJ family response regulator